QDPAYFAVHQVTVDAFAARRMVSRPSFDWSRPPDMSGVTTVLDVLEASDPAAHERAVLAWGADVWGAWAAHHETVRAWLKQSFT
ncbi:MAG: DUF5946 family protein, partial [Thermoleophilaceae bacterium]